MRDHSGSRRGFTLMELLVVVSIIALLMSLLLPSLGGAKEAARSSVCASNQRQLAVAAAAYANDSQDWMNPLEDYRYPGGVKVETTFRYLLFDYVGGIPKIFDCPSELSAVYADGLSPTDAAYGGLTLTAGTDWARLYGVLHPWERWNASGIGIAGVHWIRKADPQLATRVRSMPFGRPTESGYREGLTKYSSIQLPAKLIWFGDGGSGSSTLWADDNFWIKSMAPGYAQGDPGFNRLAQDDYGCRRHANKANYVFADGHAALLSANDIPCRRNECWWSVQLRVHENAVAK
jgi:prepilin-type N-terminal cleavage/methylation domain-containing protein/prepilin-type processing-associated H-X9-DG protein